MPEEKIEAWYIDSNLLKHIVAECFKSGANFQFNLNENMSVKEFRSSSEKTIDTLVEYLCVGLRSQGNMYTKATDASQPTDQSNRESTALSE